MRSSRIPRISEAEWEVMEVVWSAGAITANEVSDRLKGRKTWKPKTVQTMLRRLVDKGALTYEREGRAFRFQPAVSAEECRHEVSRSFLRRVFKGQVAPFLSTLVERDELSSEDIEELRKILEEKQ